MKKIFSVLIAILTAACLWADEVSFVAGTDVSSSLSITKSGVTVSVSEGTLSRTDNYRCYANNTMTISSTVGNITKIDFTFSGSNTGGWDASYEPNAASWTSNATSAQARLTKIVVTIGSADPSAPAINAEKINFGARTIDQNTENFVLDTTLVVTGANLPSAIVAAGSDHVTVSGTLTETGGNLNLHIVAAPGSFSETITLTSGTTVKEVNVAGLVVKTVLAPGTPTTMTKGTNSLDATVNGVTAVKTGTSSADGDMSITVPANATKLHFFAAAWNNGAGTIELSAPEGVTLSVDEVTLVADAGVSGSGTAYTLQNAISLEDHLFSITLQGVSAETQITLASGTARRFVVWGATYESASTPTAVDNIEVVSVQKIIRNGQVVIVRDGQEYNLLGTSVR